MSGACLIDSGFRMSDEDARAGSIAVAGVAVRRETRVKSYEVRPTRARALLGLASVLTENPLLTVTIYQTKR